MPRQQLEDSGLTGLFALRGRAARELVPELLDAGPAARLTGVDSRQLDASFTGRLADRELPGALPRNVEPCGRGGESHTLVTAGSLLAGPVAVEPGEALECGGSVFTDRLPA